MENRESYGRQAELLKALAHPTRLKIVHCLLQSGCRNVTCIEQKTGVSQSCVSQHLQKLRAAGVVTSERQGNEVFYRVASRAAAEVLASLFQEAEESYVL